MQSTTTLISYYYYYMILILIVFYSPCSLRASTVCAQLEAKGDLIEKKEKKSVCGFCVPQTVDHDAHHYSLLFGPKRIVGWVSSTPQKEVTNTSNSSSINKDGLEEKQYFGRIKS